MPKTIPSKFEKMNVSEGSFWKPESPSLNRQTPRAHVRPSLYT